MKNIRNFCIIAHVDHGKSTLADRLLEFTNTVTDREKKNQVLDSMELEQEHGITIKSRAIQMEYIYKYNKYIINLIDTPGHVDFSYEVSRSITSCDGALLIVDISQNIQAQTIFNFYLALEKKIKIIPILNKIDLINFNKKKVIDDIIKLVGCNKKEILCISAKNGLGIKNVLESIIKYIPSPIGKINSSLQAIIFDSIYDPYKGIIMYIRVLNGKIIKGQKIIFLSTKKSYYVDDLGSIKLKLESKNIIGTGNIGFLICRIKNISEIKVGDIITDKENYNLKLIKKIKEIKPVVFSGIYPINNDNYNLLRLSIEKLYLNDSSFYFNPEFSKSLGFGFRCGFLGILHMEIFQERLFREYGITVISTIPNVTYKIFFKKKPNCPIFIKNTFEISNLSKIKKIEEPYINASIKTLSNYVGSIIELCIKKRGILKNQFYLNNKKVKLIFELPLSEILFNFYDKLKKITKGHSFFDYYLIGYRFSDLVKINILINYQNIDTLSFFIHRMNSFNIGKKICKKLSELIPRKQFDIPIQAAIGNKIIARETIKALRKDVTAKCYGGDISRKRKLLEKQKKGKKKMRKIGNVEIPNSTFIEILKIN